MLMEFPNLASTCVSLRRIFWVYANKDGSGASLVDLFDLAVLLISKYSDPLLRTTENNDALLLYIRIKYQNRDSY